MSGSVLGVLRVDDFENNVSCEIFQSSGTGDSATGGPETDFGFAYLDEGNTQGTGSYKKYLGVIISNTRKVENCF